MNGREFEDLERELRAALDADAHRIEPSDRHAEILAATRSRRGRLFAVPGGPARRWLVPLATAASVLVGGGAIYSLMGEPPDQLPAPAVSTSPTTAPPSTTAAPTPSATAPSTGTPSGDQHPTTSGIPQTSTPRPGTSAGSGTVPVQPPVGPAPSGSGGATTPPAATVTRALPAYFVGPDGGRDGQFGLFRQFVRGQVPEGATPAQLGAAALAAAMRQPPATSAAYLQPWTGVRVTSVSVGSGRIEVSLSGPGSAAGLSSEQARLAVQQLVWTVQAGVGQGSIPVRFSVDDGSTALLGRYPTSRTYDRPSAATSYEDLAPLWIDDPAPGGSVPGGSPVTASGQACTFEGTVQWQLRRGESVVDSGTTTATSGCPTRGSWRLTLGTLSPGGYTLRVYETSAADGSTVTGEARSSFTVR